jgi:hypothetical protein
MSRKSKPIIIGEFYPDVEAESFIGKARYEETSRTSSRVILCLPDDWADFEVLAMRVKLKKREDRSHEK